MSNEKEYRAIVEKIIDKGQHGPYAVAKGKELDNITFSLKSPVWEEEDWPEPGMYVVLSRVRKKRAGWRANRGRFLKPSDESIQQTEDQKPEN